MPTVSHLQNYLATPIENQTDPLLDLSVAAAKEGSTNLAVAKSSFQCAGLNRLEVEDERALRERSSDPLGLESCAATARDTAKPRRRIGGAGIQIAATQEWTQSVL